MNKQNIDYVVNWFGNRGIEVKKSHFKKWLIVGDRLYWITKESDSVPCEIASDNPLVVYMCNLNSLYFEIEDEINFKDSPLAHRKLYKDSKVTVLPDSVQLLKAIQEDQENYGK